MKKLVPLLASLNSWKVHRGNQWLVSCVVILVVLVAGVQVSMADVWVKTGTAGTDSFLVKTPPEKKPDKLSVNGFAGQALDQVSGAVTNGFSGGIVIDYQVTDKFKFSINTYHSTRQAETTFEDLLLSSSTIEWNAGVQYRFKQLDDTDLSVVINAGFISMLDEEIPDFLDNHLIGVGLTHQSGPFKGSQIIMGYGITDTYTDSRSRFKSVATLRMDDASLPLGLGVVLQAALDSDMGDGADGLRILLATLVPIDALF